MSFLACVREPEHDDAAVGLASVRSTRGDRLEPVASPETLCGRRRSICSSSPNRKLGLSSGPKHNEHIWCGGAPAGGLNDLLVNGRTL